jgi:hypothetical protein
MVDATVRHGNGYGRGRGPTLRRARRDGILVQTRSGPRAPASAAVTARRLGVSEQTLYGTRMGDADYVFTRNSTTTQHSIIELSFDMNQLLGFGASIDSVHWRRSCGNDELDVPIGQVVPDPTTLLSWGIAISFAVSGAIVLACSPKTDPCVMRVYWPLWGKETLDERQEAQSGADHQEAA